MRTKTRMFMCDFETTVYDGQDSTEVWASACVEFGTEDVDIFHSIDEQFEYFDSLNCDIICYYHNLKFDGTFWLSYLLKDLHFKQGNINSTEGIEKTEFKRKKDLENNEVIYMISDMGQWYTITYKYKNKTVEIRDSLKLLPFSVKRIGQSFGTKHKKLEMEYTGYRYAGCEITESEKEYIANDVLVVKEALEIMFQEGHSKLTIGSCCLQEFRKFYHYSEYKELFPNVYEIDINSEEHSVKTAGEWLHKSYRGGWCYLARGKENKIFTNGCTADVNSLYPSMMSSESGNKFPIGKPHFWTAPEIPFYAEGDDVFYFVHFRTRFKLKPNKLPFVQIKDNPYYRATEMLETSDVRWLKTGEYLREYVNLEGETVQAIVDLTMTEMDYRLFREHYDVEDFQIIDGCYFQAERGLFDEYIDKYRKIKMESKGAKRELAKLFLNNLYGKMASSTDSSFKVAVVTDDGSLAFTTINEHKKKPGYIPIGSAITSYARCFTIRAAQANFHGTHNRGFIYADTDSIHCDLDPQDVQGITVHPKNFCCWKLESTWDTAIFVRQKTYIEHIVEEDLEPIEEPYYNIKCAGMPQMCKDLLNYSIEGYDVQANPKGYDQEKLDFITKRRTIKDFKKGLIVPGKLLPKKIPGGTLLVETTYEMRF